MLRNLIILYSTNDTVFALKIPSRVPIFRIKITAWNTKRENIFFLCRCSMNNIFVYLEIFESFYHFIWYDLLILFIVNVCCSLWRIIQIASYIVVEWAIPHISCPWYQFSIEARQWFWCKVCVISHRVWHNIIHYQPVLGMWDILYMVYITHICSILS